MQRISHLLRRFPVVAVLLWSSFSAVERLPGQDNRWVGKWFVFKAEAKLFRGGREIPHVRIALPFTVRKVDGDLLWTGGAWIKKQDVVPLAKAVDYYTDYLRNNPRSSWAYVGRGVARKANGELDKALKDYTQAIRLDAEFHAAYYNRGTLWMVKKEYDKALKDFTEAIRLDPKNARAYGGRGIAWGTKKEYDKALKDFTEAIRLDPISRRRLLRSRHRVAPQGNN